MASLVRALYFWSVVMTGLVLDTVPSVAADSPSRETSDQNGEPASTVGGKFTAGSRAIAQDDEVAQAPVIDVLEGLRSRQLAVAAEGTGDGRMILSMTNRTQKKLRVVLPPGL